MQSSLSFHCNELYRNSEFVPANGRSTAAGELRIYVDAHDCDMTDSGCRPLVVVADCAELIN